MAEIGAGIVELMPGPTSDSSSGALPAPLQQASRVLLDLVDQIEGSTGRKAGAVALYRSGREVGCACIGGGEPDVWSHDRALEAPWLPVVADPADPAAALARGRAFALFVRADLDLRLRWPYLIGTAKPEGVIVDATWVAPEGFEVRFHRFGDGGRGQEAPRADADPEAAGAVTEAPGNFFAGWFDDLPAVTTGEATAEVPPRPIPAMTAFEADAEIPVEARDRNPLPQLIQELQAYADIDDFEQPDDRAVVAAPSYVEASSEIATPPDAQAFMEDAAPAAAPDVAVAPEFVIAPDVEVAPDAAVDAATPAAAEAIASPAPSRTIRRPQWPVFTQRKFRQPWRRLGPWAALLLVLFTVGWWVGSHGRTPEALSGRSPAVIRLLRSIGLGGARFTVAVTSEPPGAAIAVDGRPTRLTTPAEIELVPGEHRVSLSLPELGETTHWVKGSSRERVPLEASLTGSLQVLGQDIATPIAVTLDGEPRGFAPVRVTGLLPGTHDLEFTATGQPPWAQTVRIPVRGDVVLTARPFELPASGLLEMRATITDEDGTQDLKGATVWVDGERRGTLPLTLELPRGPHSLRAENRGEQTSVQLIDLPGGNRRYATFAFGTGATGPRLVLQSPRGPVARDVPTPVSVSLQGASIRDVREMWLHVGGADGGWTRYPMTVLKGDAGVVGVAVFPAAQIDSRVGAPFYVSALLATGEECFTEVSGASPPARRPAVATTDQ